MRSAGINACVGVGGLAEARALLSAMRAQGMPPDLRAYNMLLKGASRGGDLAALDDLLAALRSEVRHSGSRVKSPRECVLF